MVIEARVGKETKVHVNEVFKDFSLEDRANVLGNISADGRALCAIFDPGLGNRGEFSATIDGVKTNKGLRISAFLRAVEKDLIAYTEGVKPGEKLYYHPGEIIEAFADIAYPNSSKEQAIQQALQDIPKVVKQLREACKNNFWGKPATAAVNGDNSRKALLLFTSYAQASVNASKDFLNNYRVYKDLPGIKARAAAVCPHDQLI